MSSLCEDVLTERNNFWFSRIINRSEEWVSVTEDEVEEKIAAEMRKNEEERGLKTDLEFGVDSVKSTHQMFEEEFKGLW